MGKAMLGIAGMLALALTMRGAELERYEFRQTHMGSEFRLVLYCADGATARRASDIAYARIAALDLALSDYNPESELMRLCERAGKGPVAVSEDLYRVLAKSLEMSRASDGAFDVTVGPVVHLWRRARRQKMLPDRDKLAQARALVGYQNVRLDERTRTVELIKPGMKLDLGGIAKGFAAHEAIMALRELGVTSALVAGAGDIAVSNPPPGRSGWTIAINNLQSPQLPPNRHITLSNASVSTAGDAEQFVEIGGKRYSHIVDPRTGLGLQTHSSVTVVAPDGATADSLDTAVYALGRERGMPLIEATPGAAGLLLWLSGDREEALASRRWNAYMEAADRRKESQGNAKTAANPD
jgi:thiamine biosynthesis lipoprotein